MNMFANYQQNKVRVEYQPEKTMGTRDHNFRGIVHMSRD